MQREENGRRDGKDMVAHGLGWVSVGLGVAQVAAPRRVARIIGVRGDDTHSVVLRAVGLREIASGVGILSRSRPAGWLWSRVAGDVIDLALLTAADAKRRPRVRAAMAAVAGVMVPDVLESVRVSRDLAPTDEDAGGVHVRASVTVNRPRDVVSGSWDENDSISRRSLLGSEAQGSVRFVPAPGGRGTEIHVDLRYDPPGGGLATVVAKVVGKDPEQQVKDDLRRFKQQMEAGEIVVSEGSPEGLTARRQLRQKPANPVSVEGAAR